MSAPVMAQDLADTLVDPEAYAAVAPIDAAFARLRREAPLAVATPKGYEPFWAVTRHADIQEVERRGEVFLAGLKPVNLTAAPAFEDAPSVRTLVQMDGPEHLAFRRLTQAWFMPQNLRNLEPRIRQTARAAVDRMAAMGGRCDFARDVALLYPLRVIMEILGVPEPDEPLMLKLTQEMFGANDAEMNRSGAAKDAKGTAEDLRQVINDFMAYFAGMITDRRARPTGDLASVIANGEIEGRPIGYPEAIGYYVITATAGHDTTSNTVAAGLWALAERPQLLAELKADPSLIPGHVEESIRWATSVKHFMRTAAQDAEVAGQAIRKGDWLMLCYGSANRDEAVFERPFDYDPRRAPNRHLAFGHGAHVCLGQHLGRLEMRIFWEELLPRLKSVALDGTPCNTAATFVSGPKHVPIRYVM
jgi:cytochrome P450